MRTECISDFVSLGGKTYPCPISVAMDLVGGKWKAVILYHLQHGPKRFGELRRALISPTEAVLSNQLRRAHFPSRLDRPDRVGQSSGLRAGALRMKFE